MQWPAAELQGQDKYLLSPSSLSTRSVSQARHATAGSLRKQRPFTANSGREGRGSQSLAKLPSRSVTAAAAAVQAEPDVNQHVREGATEADLVQLQVLDHAQRNDLRLSRRTCLSSLCFAGSCPRISPLTQAHKADEVQQRLADALPAYDIASGVADALVVGCGPAGLALAAELARRDVQVVLIGAPPLTCMVC